MFEINPVRVYQKESLTSILRVKNLSLAELGMHQILGFALPRHIAPLPALRVARPLVNKRGTEMEERDKSY